MFSMKLAPINSQKYNTPFLSFRGNIIDCHTHTGNWMSVDYSTDMLDVFIKEPLNVSTGAAKQTDSVEKMLVSNLNCMKGEESLDEIRGNIEMLDICKKNPKLFPLAVCQPAKTGGSAAAIRQLLNENEGKFVGLKFHPEGLPLIANDSMYDDYLKLAEAKKLPCLFHSQVNIDWKPDATGNFIPNVVEEISQWSNSDPQFIYELAKRHPKVPVILGHTGAGGALAHKKAIDVLVESIENNDAKLYCDISWMDFQNDLPVENSKSLVELIQRLKEKNALDRILFGTDSALGCYGGRFAEENGRMVPAKEAYERTVSTVKTTIKQNFGDEADDIIQKIFYDNADELFFKKGRAKDKNVSFGSSDAKNQNATQVVKNMNKTRTGLLFAGALIAIAGISVYINSKIKQGNYKK